MRKKEEETHFHQMNLFVLGVGAVCLRQNPLPRPKSSGLEGNKLVMKQPYWAFPFMGKGSQISQQCVKEKHDGLWT